MQFTQHLWTHNFCVSGSVSVSGTLVLLPTPVQALGPLGGLPHWAEPVTPYCMPASMAWTPGLCRLPCVLRVI